MTTIISDYQRAVQARAEAREAERAKARHRRMNYAMRSPEQLAEDARCRKAFRQRGIDAYRLVTLDDLFD